MKNSVFDKQHSGMPLRKRVEEAFKRIVDRTERRESSSGRSSGSKKIDYLCGKMQPGDLLIYAGYPAQYKTSLIMQIAAGIAAEKVPVLWCSPTLSSRQITRRLLASTARIPLACITAAMLSDHHWPELTRAVGRLIGDVPFYIKTDAAAPDLAGIRDQILEQDIQLLVLDPMQMPEGQATGITTDLKQLAVDCDITVIAVIDLPGQSTKNNKPEFNELWQFKDIEDDADSVCLLYRQTIPDPHGTKPHIDCLTVTNGADTCRLFSAWENQKFSDNPPARKLATERYHSCPDKENNCI